MAATIRMDRTRTPAFAARCPARLSSAPMRSATLPTTWMALTTELATRISGTAEGSRRSTQTIISAPSTSAVTIPAMGLSAAGDGAAAADTGGTGAPGGRPQ
jgi:hypothetical protein